MADLMQWVDESGQETSVFIGTDLKLEFVVLNAARTEVVDVVTWELSFMVKRKLSNEDADALITKSTTDSPVSITVTGTYAPDPDTNTQVVTVELNDTDTDDLAPGPLYCELKRMDDGLEAVLSYGVFPLVRGVHRS